ncbi:hypothetical protein CLIB1444_03S06722 [[Candida] jaroonii]|uniref:Uncharacterized protein n=1 Tax=[Candida] jaroonii TaxID=467808 RepID=A0ACA9Y5P6_9ASCO|nr:hypothetical protein CLIB1444_03S06722 [[Candida] jaroonii]
MSRIPKRPLESIENTFDAKVSTSKEPSLDFTLARIGNDTKKSQIPTLRSKNPSLDLQHINKLIGLNQTLKQSHTKKPPQPVPEKPHDKVEQDIKTQIQKNKKLSEDIKDLTTRSDSLEVEVVDLRRNQKRMYHNLSDYKTEIISSKRKFAYLEESIMNNVLNREKLINVKIKEFSQNLQNNLHEIKYELDNELKLAEDFKDEDIEGNIQQLKQEVTDLSHQLTQAISNTNHQLHLYQVETDNQLTKQLESKVQQSEMLVSQYKSHEVELNHLKEEFADITNDIEHQKSTNQSIEQRISTIQTSETNFTAIKTDLMKRINDLDHELSIIKAKEAVVTQDLNDIDTEYQDLDTKISHHTKTRRILENAMFNYQGKRVYITIPDDIPITNNSFRVQNQNYEFSKVFHTIDNQSLIEEFQYFTLSSIKQPKVLSYIFGGHPSNLMYDTIVHTQKLLQTTSLSFKGFEIHNDYVEDLLDSHRIIHPKLPLDPISIPGQSMIIDDVTNFQSIVQSITSKVSHKLFIMTLTTKQFESHLLFIEGHNSHFSTIIKNTKPLYIINCQPFDTEIIKSFNL